MARDFASVNVAIWADPEWRALPPAAQHLYLLLWTSPGLSYCGVHDWRPGRLAALSNGFTAEHIETVAACLTARHFLVIDDDTEEALVRSWARFDGLMKKPRMAVSFASAYASVASATLRMVLVREVEKIREESPELSCWGDSRVAQILSHPSVAAKDLPTPSDPFTDGFTEGLPMGLPQTAASVCLPPTPAPAPAPNTSTPRGTLELNKRAQEHPIPEDWQPTPKHAEVAKERGLDLAEQAFRFRNHAIANDRRQRNWNATFNTWLSKATEYAPQKTKATGDEPYWSNW